VLKGATHRGRFGAVAAGLGCLLASLALASSTSASTLTATDITSPDWQDYCGPNFRVDYTSAAGESNRVETAFVPRLDYPLPTIGPVCTAINPAVATVTDPGGATIRAFGDRCSTIGPSVGRCLANNLVAYRIDVGALRDVVRVSNGPPATVIAGGGPDDVNTVNGHGYDSVSCGTGIDGAAVDVGDFVADDCEKVSRF
jgi:hypothetical protein